MKKVIKTAKKIVVVACALTFLVSPALTSKKPGVSTYRMNDVWFIGGL